MKLINFLKKIRLAGNKGFSMVELICTMAIVGVIGTAVSGVLVVSADSYHRGTNETEIQQEAQLVANQINDLLIDAPSNVQYDASSYTLKITKNGVEYTVQWKNGKLYYKEGSTEQLMAENVTWFDVDTADYSTHGYARMELNFENGGRTYPAAFTISARNKETTDTTVVAASISTTLNHIMEPNESRTFTATVSGITNTNVQWGIYNNTIPTDSNTKFVGNALQIGGDEASNFLRAFVRTEATDAGGNPMAEKAVLVRLRRVTGINVTGQRISGVDKKAGSKYRITSKISGINLDLIEGSEDYNAINPYNVTWSATGGNVSIVEQPVDPAKPDERSVIMTLNEDMAEGATITVVAQSKHAAGVNRTSSGYATIEDDYELYLSPSYLNPGAGWMRMSNQAQGTIDDTTPLKTAFGGVKHKVLIKYREYPGGTYQTEWLPNIYGDADDSSTINLRPLVTGALDYRKDYEFMLKLVVVDAADNIVWPVAGETPDSEYLLVEVMPKVGVTFKSDLLGISETLMVEEAAAPSVAMSKDTGYDLMQLVNVVGIDPSGNGFINGMVFYLDKKNASGGWDEVTSGIEIQNQNGNCKLTFRGDGFSGNYRLRVKSMNQPKYELNADGTLNYLGDILNYELSDVSSGHNVFYFNVTQN